jgi:ectoine hydroxylase-related dioxygenase (phytanoyl-CoA dioxygenase family)
MLYLDPLQATSGALRVVEGSHRNGALRAALEDGARPNSRCPVRTLEVTPGDLVVFDFRVFHASFGGGVGRRVLSMDFGPSASRLGEAKRLFLENATRHPSPDEYATLGRTPTARARASG